MSKPDYLNENHSCFSHKTRGKVNDMNKQKEHRDSITISVAFENKKINYENPPLSPYD